jgi:hypothetical protein
MIIKITPNNQKAESLVKIANITLDRLNETNIEKYPSNSLTDYYDIIHQYLEAISSLKGIKITDTGAHQELIDYISKDEKLPESERIFLQELRDYRNRINYEGFFITPEYILRNKEKIEKIIKKLSGIFSKKFG